MPTPVSKHSGSLPLLILLALCACSDLDPVSGGLPRGDNDVPGDTDSPPNVDFPIPVGTQLHFQFGRSYTPDHSFSAGGLTANERQMSGHICTEVAAVDDGYADDTETTVTAAVYVSGFGDDTELDFNGTDAGADPDPSVTAEEVDSVTQNLWLSALTMPTRNHGYRPRVSGTFATRASLAPPEQSLLHLLFYDNRESLNRAWAGWTSDGTVEGAGSLVGAVHRYFFDTYDIAYFRDRTRFKEDHNERGSGCDGYTDSTACQVGSCDWDFQAESCGPPDTHLEMVWREELTAGPAGLVGPVIHSLRIEFTDAGIVDEAHEYIIRDLLPPEDCEPLVVEGDCTAAGCTWDAAEGACRTFNLSLFMGCAPGAPYDYTAGPCASGFVDPGAAPFDVAPCTF